MRVPEEMEGHVAMGRMVAWCCAGCGRFRITPEGEAHRPHPTGFQHQHDWLMSEPVQFRGFRLVHQSQAAEGESK